jgi:NAD(P)-dependent dehydrogenase (short-subunit alcohol dehydrogenase family)
VVEEFRAQHGRADVLTYDARVSPTYASAERVAEKDWDDILATNLTGAFCAAQAFARPIIPRKRPGRSSFIGSENSVVGDSKLVAYTASKVGWQVWRRRWPWIGRATASGSTRRPMDTRPPSSPWTAEQ